MVRRFWRPSNRKKLTVYIKPRNSRIKLRAERKIAMPHYISIAREFSSIIAGEIGGIVETKTADAVA
jgi:hypothetical protein